MKTHGKSKTRLYTTWVDLKSRCSNPNDTGYQNYGGRGIAVCDEWEKDFMTFYFWAMSNGYAPDLTIDRIDSGGDYTPENCRFVDRTTQARNTRKRKDNTSGYIGVNWDKASGKWKSKLNVDGKEVHLGLFTSKVVAVLERDRYILQNNLEHTRNTPMHIENIPGN